MTSLRYSFKTWSPADRRFQFKTLRPKYYSKFEGLQLLTKSIWRFSDVLQSSSGYFFRDFWLNLLWRSLIVQKFKWLAQIYSLNGMMEKFRLFTYYSKDLHQLKIQNYDIFTSRQGDHRLLKRSPAHRRFQLSPLDIFFVYYSENLQLFKNSNDAIHESSLIRKYIFKISRFQ